MKGAFYMTRVTTDEWTYGKWFDVEQCGKSAWIKHDIYINERDADGRLILSKSSWVIGV